MFFFYQSLDYFLKLISNRVNKLNCWYTRSPTPTQLTSFLFRSNIYITIELLYKSLNNQLHINFILPFSVDSFLGDEVGSLPTYM